MSALLDIIDHCAVRVNDLEAAIHWYMTSFSCEIIYRDRTQAILQFNNIKLTLVLPSQEPGHVAFIRADAATLGELRPRADGSQSTFISDPSGNPVEIIAAPAAKTGEDPVEGERV